MTPPLGLPEKVIRARLAMSTLIRYRRFLLTTIVDEGSVISIAVERHGHGSAPRVSRAGP